MRAFRIIAALSLAALCVACSDRPAPINAGANHIFFGHLVRGEKFGVRVGEPAADAARTLQADGALHVGDDCSFFVSRIVRCTSAVTPMTFSVNRPLRHGTLVLEVVDGRVKGIGWSFYLLSET